MSENIEEIQKILFNKILWCEKLEEDIINLAEIQGLNTELLIKEINGQYGPKLPNLPLEEMVDSNDINGWLQEKIISAESRTAAWIIRIINKNNDAKSNLDVIYENQGKRAAEETLEKNIELNTAIQIFNALYEYLLDGINSDKVNEIISVTDDRVEWKIRICVHETAWTKENGNVSLFYDLRNKWINGFVKNINSDFKYLENNNDVHIIEKRVKI